MVGSLCRSVVVWLYTVSIRVTPVGPNLCFDIEVWNALTFQRRVAQTKKNKRLAGPPWQGGTEGTGFVGV